jgi:hypothetical protein
VTVESGSHFIIDLDTTSFHEFETGRRMAACRQIYVPVTVEFKPLKEVLKSPSSFDSRFDTADWGRDEQIVLAFMAAALFKDRFPGAPETGDALVVLAGELNNEVKLAESINESLVREFSREGAPLSRRPVQHLAASLGRKSLRHFRRNSSLLSSSSASASRRCFQVGQFGMIQWVIGTTRIGKCSRTNSSISSVGCATS